MKSQGFEQNKVYRFVPTKTIGFRDSVRNSKYEGEFIWELEIVNPFKILKDCDTVVINGYLIKREWCEEVQ